MTCVALGRILNLKYSSRIIVENGKSYFWIKTSNNQQNMYGQIANGDQYRATLQLQRDTSLFESTHGGTFHEQAGMKRPMSHVGGVGVGGVQSFLKRKTLHA